MAELDTTVLNLDREMSSVYETLDVRARRPWPPETTVVVHGHSHSRPRSLRNIMQPIASAQEWTPSWNWRVVLAVGLHAHDNRSTRYFSSDRLTSDRAVQIDWDRWHELLSIRDSRPMNPSEQREYEGFEAIVAEQDAQEEARSNAALDLLEEKHALVISSIERLTVAVRKAAQRDR